jgi:branched-subunit amino acid aminotransferase/4-amino-4-deoxychorismate lyase
MSFINLQGECIDAGLPVLNVQNRGFRYGDALFETIRVMNGQPCFLEHHINRLLEGMKLMKMNKNEHFQADFFAQEIKKILEKNNISSGGRVRLTIFRNDGGYYTPLSNDVCFLIEAEPINHNEYVLNKDGLKVDLYEEQKMHIHKFVGLKSANALMYVMAAIYKQEKKLDECILMNEMGCITESISSNLFIGYNGVFYTPSINQGLIPGVMRKQVIEVLKIHHIELQECTLTPQVLFKADEVFLTNAIDGIKWVGAYRSKRFFNKSSKLLLETINQKMTESQQILQS